MSISRLSCHSKNLTEQKKYPVMPNNRSAVYNRTYNTLMKLKQQPEKLNHCVDAMSKKTRAGHVEPSPWAGAEAEPGKSWFIPIFPASQPKTAKTRLIFDSSAK